METQLFNDQMDNLDLAFNQDSNAGRRFIYWQRLRNQSDATFVEAIARAIDTLRFFPTVATLHGLCDRVNEERMTTQRSAADESGTLRLRGETNLPLCATCNDLGWVRVENAAPHQPSTLTKCFDCETAFKGRDPGRAQREHDAYAYFLERDHAAHPVFPAPVRHVVFESAEPPSDDFAQRGIPVPETPSERVKRQIAESAARMQMSKKPHETR